MRRSSSLESVNSMVSVANDSGGLESMQEAKATCNSVAQLSTGKRSFDSRPQQEEAEEEGDKEVGEEDGKEEEEDDKDGSECSSNCREDGGFKPANKRFNVEDEGEAINSRLQILQTLVPGGPAMDTVSLLEQTAFYIKLLMETINAVKR